MSRFKTAPEILQAANSWRERCLLSDGSAFSDGGLWATPTVAHLMEHFVNDPDESNADFFAKLQKQLGDAPPEACKLAAEMIWVTYLFVSTSSIAAETKLRHIRRIWEWSKEPFPQGSPLIAPNALLGAGSVGTAFFTGARDPPPCSEAEDRALRNGQETHKNVVQESDRGMRRMSRTYPKTSGRSLTMHHAARYRAYQYLRRGVFSVL